MQMVVSQSLGSWMISTSSASLEPCVPEKSLDMTVIMRRRDAAVMYMTSGVRESGVRRESQEGK